jgi:hypothetical protein
VRPVNRPALYITAGGVGEGKDAATGYLGHHGEKGRTRGEPLLGATSTRCFGATPERALYQRTPPLRGAWIRMMEDIGISPLGV